MGEPDEDQESEDRGESDIFLTEEEREMRKIDTYEYYLNWYPFSNRKGDMQ